MNTKWYIQNILDISSFQDQYIYLMYIELKDDENVLFTDTAAISDYTCIILYQETQYSNLYE